MHGNCSPAKKRKKNRNKFWNTSVRELGLRRPVAYLYTHVYRHAACNIAQECSGDHTQSIYRRVPPSPSPLRNHKNTQRGAHCATRLGRQRRRMAVVKRAIFAGSNDITFRQSQSSLAFPARYKRVRVIYDPTGGKGDEDEDEVGEVGVRESHVPQPPREWGKGARDKAGETRTALPSRLRTADRNNAFVNTTGESGFLKTHGRLY